MSPTRRVLASALLGAVAALAVAACAAGGSPSPVASPSPLPVPISSAPSPVAAPPTITPSTTASPTTTSARKPTTTKATPKRRTVAECNKIASSSSRPNSELGPYLRSIGCDDAADGLLVGEAGPVQSTPSPGELALEACQRQTGMTRAECIADSAAGNAN